MDTLITSLIYACLFFFSVITLSNAYVLLSGRNKKIRSQETGQVKDAILILGAGVWRNGKLTPILRDRTDTALLAYKEKKARVILISGDNGKIDYNEVTPVRRYLIQAGVPEKDIFLDYAGFDTYDSLYRARDIFGIHSLLVVTQSFHMPRALFIGAALGLTIEGLVATGSDVPYSTYIRELFARVKAVLEVTLARRPQYLGKKIPITGDGRASWSETEED